MSNGGAYGTFSGAFQFSTRTSIKKACHALWRHVLKDPQAVIIRLVTEFATLLTVLVIVLWQWSISAYSKSFDESPDVHPHDVSRADRAPGWCTSTNSVNHTEYDVIVVTCPSVDDARDFNAKVTSVILSSRVLGPVLLAEWLQDPDHTTYALALPSSASSMSRRR